MGSDVMDSCIRDEQMAVGGSSNVDASFTHLAPGQRSSVKRGRLGARSVQHLKLMYSADGVADALEQTSSSSSLTMRLPKKGAAKQSRDHGSDGAEANGFAERSLTATSLADSSLTATSLAQTSLTESWQSAHGSELSQGGGHDRQRVGLALRQLRSRSRQQLAQLSAHELTQVLSHFTSAERPLEAGFDGGGGVRIHPIGLTATDNASTLDVIVDKAQKWRKTRAAEQGRRSAFGLYGKQAMIWSN